MPGLKPVWSRLPVALTVVADRRAKEREQLVPDPGTGCDCGHGVGGVSGPVLVDDGCAGLSGEDDSCGDIPGAVGESHAGVDLALGQPGEIDGR